MKPSQEAPRRGTQVLEASGVSKTFGKTPALYGIDFTLGPGEFVAISGRSGSGKSTLLLCLSGIILPDAGEVRFGEHSLHLLSEAQRSRLRRTDFGVLFQFGQLVPELTAAENVALPLLLEAIPRATAFERARALLAGLGIEALQSRRPTEMSGGQAQRVALARSLVTGPVILFADEPTGALDHEASDTVLELMTRAAEEENTAIVLVTHDDGVAAHASRRVVLEDGRIAFDG